MVKKKKQKSQKSSTPLPSYLRAGIHHFETNKNGRFFNTPCCNANFKGIMINGNSYIICEKCSKKVGIFGQEPLIEVIAPLKGKNKNYLTINDIEGENTETYFTDIYDGDFLMVWKDEMDCYFFQTLNVTLHFDKDEWKEFRKDLTRFNDL